MKWYYEQPVKIIFGAHKIQELSTIIQKEQYKKEFWSQPHILLKMDLQGSYWMIRKIIWQISLQDFHQIQM